jgi:XRE family transcriptional regulator, regulator of sulfur utilization
MSTQLPQLFGLAVRQQRERLGWSQERLAESADLNRSYVGELERGQAVPSLITLDKLARALGLSPSNLLAQTERLSQQRLISGLSLAAIAC